MGAQLKLQCQGEGVYGKYKRQSNIEHFAYGNRGPRQIYEKECYDIAIEKANKLLTVQKTIQDMEDEEEAQNPHTS